MPNPQGQQKARAQIEALRGGSALRDIVQGASNAAAGTVSGPVDLMAAALRALGAPIPSDPVGGSEWMRGKGLMRDTESPVAGAIGEAAGSALPIAAAAKAPQIAQSLLRHGEQYRRYHAATTAPGAPATVWHGSPHRFDKFDSSKIGTGEGAQAYGHGLYFAESPEVAKSYKNLKPISDPTDTGYITARAAFDIGKGDSKAAIKWLEQRAASVQQNAGFLTDKGAGQLADIARARELIQGGAFSPGHLYKVDLPDDAIAKMIDYDAHWNKQSDAVRAAIDTRRLEEFYRSKDIPASQVIHHLGQAMPPSEAAEFFRKQGIPGIRYLDGGSRSAGNGTRNYVVFPGEERLLTILSRE